jgi:putative ABC transport system permease protein
MLVHLYAVRLRSHAVQELLAASGIAIGVALVLGVLVANSSLTGSAAALEHRVVGSARLELAARSPQGFDERLALASKGLAGVQVAAPALRQNVALVGPDGHRVSVQLLGVAPAVTSLGGLRSRDLGGVRLSGGLVLPESVASALGVEEGERVTVLAGGEEQPARVGAVLDDPSAGVLASSPVAVTLLPVAQRLTGMPGLVTEVLVRPFPGQEAIARRGLQELAAGHLDVLPANNELRLLNEAARPNNQSTTLFAAISVMVGFLLALNAMLLTVPERRRFVADLRIQGYDWRQILAILSFQACVLGVVASTVGVLLGDLLSRTFFHRIPVYLVTAFPIGNLQTLHAGAVLLALGCGVLAALLASLSPALDLRPNRPTDAVFRDPTGGSEVLAPRTMPRLALVGVGAIALITLLVLVFPGLTIFGGVLLALATLCLIPAVFAVVGRALRFGGERIRSSALIIVVSELRTITTRTVALAGVAALAVYGNVAIGGARADLLRGLDANFDEYLRTAEVWVTTGGNDLTTNAFAGESAAAAIARAPGVASVRAYGGGFLDVGSRRMWVIGRPRGDTPLLPKSQLLHGDLARAEARLRAGGWAAVSAGIANERHLHVGSTLALPTPSGSANFRVAAILTNLGWAPGAVIINSDDYRRAWLSNAASALEVRMRPGISPAAGARAVRAALRGREGLGVQSFDDRRAQYAADSRQGLQALSEIATLLLLAAALAVAAALGAAIWQRRPRLASLKIQGYDTGQLWRALLLEGMIVLGVGALLGAATGIYGHALASRWLRLRTGFPAPFGLDLGDVLLTLWVLAAISAAVVAIPGYAAARAPARTSVQE